MDINQQVNQSIVHNLCFKTHKSPVLLFLKFLFMIIILDIILIIIFFFSDLVNINVFTDIKIGVLLSIMLFYIIFFIYWFLSWSLDYFTVQEWKITHRRWILIKRINLYTILDVNSIKLKQSFFWRIFWYSHIEITYNEKTEVFRFVNYPEEFIQMIDVFKNQAIQTPVGIIK